MREQQNRAQLRPAYILTSQATNPVPAGSTGLWFDGTHVYLVNSSGGTTLAVSDSGTFTPTGVTSGFVANTATPAMGADSTSTGGTGSTAYTFGDVVKALKTLGLVAA